MVLSTMTAGLRNSLLLAPMPKANSEFESSNKRIQPSVSFDVNVKDESQTSIRRLGRSKSEIELEEKMERRAQELQELIELGQATLDQERCDIQDLEEDDSISPTKRRRRAGDSWKLLFEYADEVSTQLEHIDREYKLELKSFDSVNQVSAPVNQDGTGCILHHCLSLASTVRESHLMNGSPRRYDVPMELLFVDEAAAPPESEKHSLACAATELSKVDDGLEMEIDPTVSTDSDKGQSYTSPLCSPATQSLRRFWPEVSQLRKDMDVLREKLSEAKRERSRTNKKIQDLSNDLTKLGAPSCK